ncbi:MAG: outer membrane beta-barrel protein [Granulosicoccus sp.]
MRTLVNPPARSLPFGNPRQYTLALPILPCLALLAGMLVSAQLYAQEGAAASIPVGDARLTPQVDVEYTTTDNVFLTDKNLTSSYGVVVRPSVSLSADKRLSRLRLVYTGAYASFNESQLDYTDHLLGINGSQEVSRKLRFDAGLRLKYDHQELGTGFTIGNAENFSEQATFRSYEAGAGVNYGAVDAKGNLRVGIRLRDRAATNLRNETREYDFSSVTPFVEFSLRVSPDTRAFVKFQYSDVDYEVGISRDREVLSAFTGLSLAATGKLSGTMQVGVSDVNNIDPLVRDSEELVLRAALRYRPVDYSTFDLEFSRDFDLDLETFETVDVTTDRETITDRMRLGWRHEWSSRLYHEAGISYSNVDRGCTEGNSYETVGGDFFLNLFVKRWLILGAGILGDQRDDICNDTSLNIEYERQKAVVRLKATL